MNFLDALTNLFTSQGYLAVFVVLLICGFGVPVPEDVTLIAGGIIAGLGYADVRIMAGVGLAGVLMGDASMFLIGRHLGARALRRPWVARLLTPRRYAKVQAKFDRYGNRLMFIARFLPGLRAAVFLTAGMTRRVSFPRFLALDGLAALISVPVWIALGYYGAENHAWLLTWMRRGQGGLAVAALLLVIAIAAFYWLRAQRRRERLLECRALREARASQAGEAGPRD
ncbi:DedA family protein [Dokdonella sp.]|uniref:DedA family protein n=1 Tax=Dokdonella sp. TaxID=2291710 RepID=UPI0031BF4817|nr:DedA family protein [Dokdonella sp.]